MGDPKPGSAALKVLFRHLAAPKNSQNFLNLLIPCLGPLPKGNFSVQNPKNPACGSSQWETPLGAFSAPKSHPWNSIPSRPTQGQRENPPQKWEQFCADLGLLPKEVGILGNVGVFQTFLRSIPGFAQGCTPSCHLFFLFFSWIFFPEGDVSSPSPAPLLPHPRDSRIFFPDVHPESFPSQSLFVLELPGADPGFIQDISIGSRMIR